MNDAYQDGHDAFNKGAGLEANPYRGEADKKKSWDDGWEDAKLEADLKRRAICSNQEGGPAR